MTEFLPLPVHARPMINNLIAMLDYSPGALFIVLLLGAFIGIGVERLVEYQRKVKRQAYWKGRKHGAGRGWKGKAGAGKKADLKAVPDKPSFDAADQLRIVMSADFTSRPLLNTPERRVLTSLDKILAEEAPGWRAMCQVSLGEILASKQEEAFRAVNSKRVDFLVVDAASRPLGVIEYQGDGHHQGTAAARDAVKKEALRRAAIDFYEISAGDKPAELRAIILKLVGRRQPSPARPGA